MKLHDNKDVFYEIITAASGYFRIDAGLIEKDYFVTELLIYLSENCPNIVFKGGTSLSKCYDAINRFSEDIDISLTSKTIGNKRNLKKMIFECCKNNNLKIRNEATIYSHRNFNRYEIDYPLHYAPITVKSEILLETTFITSSEPYKICNFSSLIYKYLGLNNLLNVIRKYNIKSGRIRTQSIEKTFVDKVFAICDIYLKNNITRNSRHIYDLHMLYPKINFDNKMKKIISNSYAERKVLKSSPSAKDGMSVNKLLQEIVDKNIYKKDFNNITKYMIYETLSYEKAITVINKIIKLNVFK